MARLGGQKPLSPSEAASCLPALIDRVTDNPGETVIIDLHEERGTAVLVDAVHYELMTLRAKLVEDREPIRLAGSINPLVSADEQEARIAVRRKRQTELAAAKLKDL